MFVEWTLVRVMSCIRLILSCSKGGVLAGQWQLTDKNQYNLASWQQFLESSLCSAAAAAAHDTLRCLVHSHQMSWWDHSIFLLDFSLETTHHLIPYFHLHSKTPPDTHQRMQRMHLIWKEEARIRCLLQVHQALVKPVPRCQGKLPKLSHAYSMYSTWWPFVAFY